MCRNRHIPADTLVLSPPIVLDSVSNFNPFTVRPNLADSQSAVGAASSPREPLQVSTIRETVVCPVYQLSQFERGTGKCRRCHHSLGIAYIEILLSHPRSSLDSRQLITIRLQVGGLIRRLRTRRGITQAELASLTGIHRTYLPRAERGQVTPSVIALMQISGALGVDKILLRVSSSAIRS
jgi:DNA-binding XRE family transcriptional regulator